MSGLPYGKSASVNRCLSLYAIFDPNEFNILVVNHTAGNKSESRDNIGLKGNFKNINYIYTTPTPYKPISFLKRRYYKFIGRLNEFRLLIKLGFKKDIDIILYYPDGFFFDLFFYRVISKIFRISLVSHYVEFRSSFKRKGLTWKRINDILFDKYFMYLSDGVIPISNFLYEYVESKKKDVPQIKIPPVIDFSIFEKIEDRKIKEDYFLYVGAAGYFKAIKLILDAFAVINNKNYCLYLVLHGKGKSLVESEVNKHSKKGFIKLFSNLEYEKLLEFNKNARTLLIPLENTIKDRARFPQKISEYLASGNPIITTNFGEITYYFEHLNSALIANECDAESISEQMEYAINNKKESRKIGEKGYDIGIKYFNTVSYSGELTDFMKRMYFKNNIN